MDLLKRRRMMMGRKGGYETLPLTFHIIEGSGILSKAANDPPQINLEMRINGGNWHTFASTSISAGDIIEFRGEGYPAAAAAQWTALYCTDGVTAFEIYGNVMSIPYGNNFVDKVAITQDYAFHNLFSANVQGANAGLISAANLILPALTLSMYCYLDMFNGCTSLVETPELPATTLAPSCYNGMFRSCYALTTAPDLPATTLAPSCYSGMFRYCTGLTEAPDLPATTLASSCYMQMFFGCTSLILAPELEAPVLAQSCYSSMFQSCSQLGQILCMATDRSASNATQNWLSGVAAQGTFYKRAGVSWPSGASGIPSGWTVIEV